MSKRGEVGWRMVEHDWLRATTGDQAKSTFVASRCVNEKRICEAAPTREHDINRVGRPPIHRHHATDTMLNKRERRITRKAVGVCQLLCRTQRCRPARYKRGLHSRSAAIQHVRPIAQRRSSASLASAVRVCLFHALLELLAQLLGAARALALEAVVLHERLLARRALVAHVDV